MPRQIAESPIVNQPKPEVSLLAGDRRSKKHAALTGSKLRLQQQNQRMSDVASNSATVHNVHATEEEGITAEAAEAVIKERRIGDRIRYLRQDKGLGLVELGQVTGLSASFLSQLETGRVVPTLRNLARIAIVFSKDMSYFFEPEQPGVFRILRAGDRQRLPQSGVEDPGYYFESLGQVPTNEGISPYVAEFLPATAQRHPRTHSHAGFEFLYLLNGCMRLTYADQVNTLESGDAVYFHADNTHSYEHTGDDQCVALIITTQHQPYGRSSGSRIKSARRQS